MGVEAGGEGAGPMLVVGVRGDGDGRCTYTLFAGASDECVSILAGHGEIDEQQIRMMSGTCGQAISSRTGSNEVRPCRLENLRQKIA